MPAPARLLLGAALLLRAADAHGSGGRRSASGLISDAEALSSVDSTAAGRLLTHSIGTLESTFFWKSSKKQQEDELQVPQVEPRAKPTDTTAEPAPEPSPEPSLEPSLEPTPAATPAATLAAPAGQQESAEVTAAAGVGDEPGRSAVEPLAPKAKDTPANWSEAKKKRLVDEDSKACKTYADKSRGGVTRFFSIGSNSYQQQVDSLGDKCKDYGLLQKKAQKKRTEVEELLEDLNSLKNETAAWIKGIKSSVKEIKRKGTAIEDVARLIEAHEKEHGKSLLQNQSLQQGPLAALAAQ